MHDRWVTTTTRQPGSGDTCRWWNDDGTRCTEEATGRFGPYPVCWQHEHAATVREEQMEVVITEWDLRRVPPTDG